MENRRPALRQAMVWLGRPSCLPVAVFVLLLLAFHGIFGAFFPNHNGGLGHDYSYYMPMLLAGEYWREANGFWTLPWFTPAFCGGQPLLPDPQSFYYSVPQFLTAWVDPLRALYLSFLLFAAAGFWGFFILARRGFGTGAAAALLGAALFMFNGFFVHRMLIGHITFHGVMLIPWVSLALIKTPAARRQTRHQDLQLGILAGLCGTYWLYAGMLHLIIPSLLAVACVILMRQMAPPGVPWQRLASRGGIALAVMLGIGALKIVAALSYMQSFPRTGYSLPGADSLATGLWLILQTLFFAPPAIGEWVSPDLRQVQWTLDRHEFEFGVGVIPLLALLAILWRWVSRPCRCTISRCLMIGALTVLLLLPLLVNVYEPAWNALLKRLPIIGASSNLFRWYFTYIPVVIIATVLAVDRLPDGIRHAAVAVGLMFVVLDNGLADRLFYHRESYDPAPIVEGSRALSETGKVPEIRAVGASRASRERQFPNDPLVEGISGYPCYNPVFGYRLENLPVKQLGEGPVTAVKDGRLNLKNPACYAFPQANGCEPGDQFRVEERDAMLQFARYRPVAFKMPPLQILANGISTAVLLVSLITLVFASWCLRRSGQREGGERRD